MKKDHIVEEVRKHRREIAEECGNDFRKILDRAGENQKKFAKKTVKGTVSKKRQVPLAA